MCFICFHINAIKQILFDRKNMKFVQHVSEDEDDEEEEEEDEEEETYKAERSACEDTAESEEEVTFPTTMHLNFTNHYFFLKPSAGVCIEPIQTKAMKLARSLGQTPFALLKPARGMPVLVKVVDLPNKSKVVNKRIASIVNTDTTVLANAGACDS